MKKELFIVRRALEEDISQIQEVSREAYKMYVESAGITSITGYLEESYEDLKKELENKMIFVALSGDLVIGSVRVEVKSDGSAYLSRFGVRNDYQNNGIGKLLMNAVDNSMKELGISALFLHTASRMFSLVRFYYGRGFFIESTSKDKGYIRALLCKEYLAENTFTADDAKCDSRAVI